MRQITVQGYNVWGANANAEMYRRTGITETNLIGDGWEHIPFGNVFQIELGQNVFWGIYTDQTVFFGTFEDLPVTVPELPEEPEEPEPTPPLEPPVEETIEITIGEVDGKLVQVDVNTGFRVFGVADDYTIWYRKGIYSDTPAGTEWF
jgi:hypothetical protein